MVALLDQQTPTDDTRVIRLYSWQREAMNATEPEIACVTPVGEGKSWLGSHWIVRHATQEPDGVYLACGNSAKQIDRVILPNILKALDDYGLDYTHRVSKDEFLIHTEKGDAWLCYGSLNSEAVIDRVRGMELSKAWLDEARDTRKYALEVVEGRMRHPATRLHQILITTTPRGFNWLYDLFVGERASDTLPDGRRLRRLIHVTKRRNVDLPPGYDAMLRASYDEQLARQELEAAFVALGVGSVFRAFDRAGNVRETRYDPARPLYLGFDFGWQHQVGTVMQWHEDPKRRGDPQGGEIHVLDEAFGRHVTIEQSVGMLAPRWAKHPGGWIVGPDPAGRGHDMAGHTDHQLLMRALELHGFQHAKLEALPKAPLIRDVVNVVNAWLRNAEGRRRLFIDPSCKHLIADLERCQWNDAGNEVDRDDEERTHCTDSLKYILFKRHRPSAFKREVGHGRERELARAR